MPELKQQDILKKAQQIIEKQKKEDDGDKHVKTCLEARICPWCGNDLRIKPIGLPGYYLGADFYCPRCKDHIDDFCYYDNDYVNKRIREAKKNGKRA